MTCRGYDYKTVRIGKPIKTLAATIKDPHQRGAFIRSYVQAIKENTYSSKRTKDSKE